jgi:hypothetical protein
MLVMGVSSGGFETPHPHGSKASLVVSNATILISCSLCLHPEQASSHLGILAAPYMDHKCLALQGMEGTEQLLGGVEAVS